MRQQVRIVAHRNKSGNISLRLRCHLGDKDYDIATAITLSPSEWDNRRQRVLPAHPDHNALNTRLNAMLDRAAEHLRQSPDTCIDALRAIIEGFPTAADRYSTDDLFDALRAFVATESRRNTWSDGTIIRFRSLSSSLAAFRPVLHLSTLTAKTIDDFIAFRASQGRNNTTIAKDVKLLLWLLRWCHDNGRYDGDLHLTYSAKLKGGNFEDKEIIYLTLDELHAIEDAPLLPSLAPVRDVFVFCCYTGLRFSDAQRLRQSDVHDTYIEIVTKKTSKRLRIELNKHSAAILDRYKTLPNGMALPSVSNQWSNRAIKEIGDLCGIDEPVLITTHSGRNRSEATMPKWTLLSTHCARRTFVVTALQLGIPIEVITRWTGHSDLKAMRPYIAIVDELKAKNMAKFDEV